MATGEDVFAWCMTVENGRDACALPSGHDGDHQTVERVLLTMMEMRVGQIRLLIEKGDALVVALCGDKSWSRGTDMAVLDLNAAISGARGTLPPVSTEKT